MAGLVGQNLGHYLLVEEVGRGGMATVFRAVDQRNEKQFAVKVLSQTIAGDKRFVKRFERESALLATLIHPNIVPVVDFGEANGLIYMVMPFIDGDTLQDRLDQAEWRSEESHLWIEQLASALDYAHRSGIIHRDVKPANVMIDTQGNALLTDFGLARNVEGSNTLTGSLLLGTPAYMAPEQGRGDRVDARSDQYSFGVIIYQLESGRLPFEAESPMGTVLMHIQDPVPRPGRFNPELSPGIERVILKSLAKGPAYRYPSVGALRIAYQAAVGGATLEELDLPTMAIPLDPSLKELRGSYEAKPTREPRLERPRRGLFTLISILILIVLGSVAYWASPFNLPLARRDSPPATTATPELATEPAEALLLPTAAIPETQIPPVISEFCPAVEMHSPQIAGNSIRWQIYNGLNQPLEIVNLIELVWPQGNGALEEIAIGDEIIWERRSGEGTEVWKLGADRSLLAGQTRSFSLNFAFKAEDTGYQLSLDFGQDCVLTGEW
jgi:serine/threonine protein kinase